MSSQNSSAPAIRKKTDFNFGVKGWLLCIYCMIGFMTIGGAFWSGTAQNVMVNIKAGQLGVEPARILSLNSIAGLISVIAILGVGILFGKYKTRIMQTLSMVICGIALIVYGRVSNTFAYVLVFIIMDIGCNATSSIGLPQICTAYFPTKKGSMLGWATIGANLAALVSLTILGSLITATSPATATLCFGIFTIAMGLINWFFIPNTPEEAGMEPDNGDFTPEELAAHKAMMSGEPIWTIKEAMKNKNFWLIGIAYGILFMASTGYLGQMVPYQIGQMVKQGVDPGLAAKTAGTYMKLLPLFAVPGSIFSGWLDQKFGTRRTAIAMAAFYAVAGLVGGLAPYNTVTNWIFVGFFFFWTGANSNLAMSHAASCFGPRDYPKIWGRMAFIVNLMRICGPLMLSMSLTYTQGYQGAYTVFGALSIVAIILIFMSDNHIIKEPGKAPTGAVK